MLSVTPYKEKDGIIEFLTEDLGVITAFAKGLVTSRKRFAGAADLFNLLKIHVKRKGKNGMFFLQWIEIQRDFAGIRTSLEALTAAQMVLWFLRKSSKELPIGRDDFLLLIDLLKELDGLKKEPWGTSLFFIVEFLDRHGFPLKCFTCSKCKRNEAGIAWGIDGQGNPLCSRCVVHGYRFSQSFKEFLLTGRFIPYVFDDLEEVLARVFEERFSLRKFYKLAK